MAKQTQLQRRCLTEAECKRVIISKCLRGDKKACRVVIKGTKRGQL